MSPRMKTTLNNSCCNGKLTDASVSPTKSTSTSTSTATPSPPFSPHSRDDDELDRGTDHTKNGVSALRKIQTPNSDSSGSNNNNTNNQSSSYHNSSGISVESSPSDYRSINSSGHYPFPFVNQVNSNSMSHGNNNHRGTLNLPNGTGTQKFTGSENESVMSNGTFMVVTRPDGSRSCMKHPHLSLEGWTCPECEKEFNEGNNALQQRKANVNSRLQELEQQQKQQLQEQQLPPGTSPPMHGMQQPPFGMAVGAMPYGGAMGSTSPYGIMAASAAGGNPMAALNGNLQTMSLNNPGTPGSTASSASLDTLALQINRMQQMQDWMLLQKEREVQMLRQELAEAQQKLHASQLEQALLQEKLTQQKIQHEQEIKLLQLQAAVVHGADHDMAENLVLKASVVSSPKSVTNGIKDGILVTPARSTVTGTMTGATNTTVPVATGVPALKQPPAASAKASNNNINNGAITIPKSSPNNKAAPVASAANNSTKTSNNNNKAPPPAKSSPAKKSAPKQTQSTDPAVAAKKNNMKQPPAAAQNASPAKASTNNKLPPKNEFGIPTDINVDDDAPPTVPLQEDITLGTLGKSHSWRTSVLERTSKAASSDRFEPRYIGSPADRANGQANPMEGGGGGDKDDNGMEAGAAFMLPNDQQSLTVASSTYGEDRQKVVNQSLLDPYGDKGIYTGLILKSTGMPHGSGRMVYEEDQRIYEGEWRHGRWHGFGKAKFANGDCYEGEYRFDQRHGQGKYSWADGRSYDGHFSEDRRHGKGLFVWPDGAIYEGEFANGQREGHGSYKFSDGGQYTGSWKDGRYNGFGTCSWEDGRCYRGEWRNGMAHGKGIETYADGSVRHDGQWVDDEPVR